jgi:hypothetical protein
MQLVVVVSVSRIVGSIAHRLGQSRVIGEMLAGFLLGPSLLGAVAPELSSSLFPVRGLGTLESLSTLGLVLYLLLVGARMDPDHLRSRGVAVVATSIGGTIVPFILGVGVGGEFPNEYTACDVPHNERGARLSEGVQVLRKFFSGEAVNHHGKFYGPFQDVPMRPPPRQPGGPPIWFAGRKEPALRRIGRLGDGFLAYVISPDMYRSALVTIDTAAEQAGRGTIPFGTGHLLFTRLDKTYEEALDRATETLSVRYAMDFRKAAQRYCALGTPQQVAETIRSFHAAGVRHIALDLLGPYEQRNEQIEWFASDVMPLLRDLTAE